MKDAKETEKDIVRALEGADAEMRAFAASLRAAPQARTAAGFTAGVMAAVRAGEAGRARRPFWGALPRLAAALPVAAGLALLFAAGSVFQRPAPAWTTARLVACQRPDGTFTASSAAPYVQAFAVTVLAKDPAAAPRALDSAVAALVREQNADGGWANPALSARNVAALDQAARAGSAPALRAYRRGMRYLRTHGIGEVTLADLVREAKAMASRLGPAPDDGLACSVARCAALNG